MGHFTLFDMEQKYPLIEQFSFNLTYNETFMVGYNHIQSNLPQATIQNAKNAEWSLTGGGRLQESNRRGSLPTRGLGTSTLWKIIYCMQSKLGYV